MNAIASLDLWIRGTRFFLGLFSGLFKLQPSQVHLYGFCDSHFQNCLIIHENYNITWILLFSTSGSVNLGYVWMEVFFFGSVTM